EPGRADPLHHAAGELPLFGNRWIEVTDHLGVEPVEEHDGGAQCRNANLKRTDPLLVERCNDIDDGRGHSLPLSLASPAAAPSIIPPRLALIDGAAKCPAGPVADGALRGAHGDQMINGGVVVSSFRLEQD